LQRTHFVIDDAMSQQAVLLLGRRRRQHHPLRERSNRMQVPGVLKIVIHRDDDIADCNTQSEERVVRP
jgi:hypothetical protein